MAKTLPELSEGATAAYNLLKDYPDGLTIAAMKGLGLNANASHLTALKRRGLVDSIEVEIEVPTVVKRKVQLYTAKESEQYMT